MKLLKVDTTDQVKENTPLLPGFRATCGECRPDPWTAEYLPRM